jgi:hypothetical protein
MCERHVEGTRTDDGSEHAETESRDAGGQRRKEKKRKERKRGRHVCPKDHEGNEMEVGGGVGLGKGSPTLEKDGWMQDEKGKRMRVKNDPRLEEEKEKSDEWRRWKRK